MRKHCIIDLLYKEAIAIANPKFKVKKQVVSKAKEVCNREKELC